MSRRGFIIAAACGAIALPLLSCTTAPQAPASSASAGGAPNAGGPLPSTIPFTGGPKPDYRSSDARVVDAFEHYPTPFKSWTKEPPGSGSRVDVLIAAYYPTPTAYDQNPTWHEVNK